MLGKQNGRLFEKEEKRMGNSAGRRDVIGGRQEEAKIPP
jgi:hypothetical protein